jgi:predicted phage terminase large subunit-like protein
VVPKVSKVERALNGAVPLVESHKVFLPVRAPWKDALVTEIAQFGEGARYTDQVDCLVYALSWARQYAYARREDDRFRQQWEGFSLFR